jgi:multiple sugar transport system substrate-binding protein
VAKLAMRKYLPILIIFISCLSLSCRNQNAHDTNRIIYWASNNTDEITFANEIVTQWNNEGSDKNVIFQPVPEGQSSEEVILAAVVGGTTPDIYSNMWQGDVELYARAGKLVPLDTLPGFMEFLNVRCDSSVIKEVTSTDGHIYQIPWKINPIMMICNDNMFKSFGWSSPPKTYSDFFKAASQIKEAGMVNGYQTKWIGYSEVIVTWWQRLFDFYPLYLAASGGGNLIKNNKVVFNNKYAVSTFQFLKTLYDNSYFPREKLSSGQDPFLSSEIAIRFTGPWEIVHSERFKPKGFEYSFSPLPVPDDQKKTPYTYGDTKNIVMFTTCKNKLASWEFIKEMVSEKGDFLLMKTTNQLPRRKDLTTNPLFLNYLNSNPKMKPFAEQSKYVKGPDSCPVLTEVFDAISQEYEACVVYGKKSPQQAVDDAAEAARIILLQ